MPSKSLTETICLTISILILITFLFAGLTNIASHPNSQRGDQGAYLALGLKVRRGIALTDGGRHPLYPLLISGFAEKSPGYFTKAKLLSLGIGFITLVVAYLAVRRLKNSEVALITTLILSLIPAFRAYSARAQADILVGLLFLITWYCTIAGFRRPNYWIAAGLSAGLAYLAKGTGPLLFLSFILSAAILVQKRLLGRSLVLFSLPFLLVSSVLLIYNYKVYGNPIYNISTQHVMWLDEYQDVYRVDWPSLPTMRTYLQTHTLFDILTRLCSGGELLKGTFIKALSPASCPWRDRLLALPLAGHIVLAVAVCISFRKGAIAYFKANKELVVFTVILLLLSLGSLAWYAPVQRSPRFLVPLFPLISPFVGELVYGLGRKIGRRFPKAWEGRIALSVYLALALLVAILALREGLRFDFRGPFNNDRLHYARMEKVRLWLAAEVGSDTKIAYGPSHQIPRWAWDDLEFIYFPWGISWESVNTYFVESDIRYVLLDRATFRRRKPLLDRWFYMENGRLSFKAQPPGWEFVSGFDGLPCSYCLFRLEGFSKSSLHSLR